MEDNALATDVVPEQGIPEPITLTEEEAKIYTALSVATCGVVLSDKSSLCTERCVDVIILGDAKAILPICAAHNSRLESGETSFLLKDLFSERMFAIQYDWDSKNPPTN